MHVGAREDAACRALLCLAKRSEVLVPGGVLARRTGLSPTFLSQVLARCSRKGLVVAHRGCRGGYRLGKPPEWITLVEILDAFESATSTQKSANAGGASAAEAAALAQIWEDLTTCGRRHLSALSLADLLARGDQLVDPRLGSSSPSPAIRAAS